MRQLLRHGIRLFSRGRRETNFTMMELVVVAAIGCIIVTTAISIVLANVRSTYRLSALRHLQEHCGWVQFLINREIEQSARTSTPLGAGRLELTVPGFSDPTILYFYHSATRELRRSGPEIDRHGRLEASSTPPSEETYDLVARDVESFVATATNPRSPRYRLKITDAGGNTYTVTQDAQGRGGGAYCRAREIPGSDSVPSP